jgi:hypothetical protein
MRNSFSTALVLAGLALVSILGWAASRAPAPAVPDIAVSTPKPAPPPPPACIPAELSLAYLAGQPGAGYDSGSIAIWDRSAGQCTLAGPIVVAGLDRAGHVTTTSLSYDVVVFSTLTAHGARPRARMQLTPGERAGQLIVSAGYQFNALHRSRPCAQRTEPSIWRLTFPVGGALTVPNADPSSSIRPGHGLPANHGLLTCRGVLNVPEPVRVVRGA